MERVDLVLHNTVKSGKLNVRNGWLMCPHCGRGKVQKIRPDTEGRNVVVFCKLCGAESVVDIESQCQCHSASASAN